MKRKLIQSLLDNGASNDLLERIAEAIPAVPGGASDAARTLLADSITVSRAAGVLDPTAFYELVCRSTPTELAGVLQGQPSGHISKRSLSAAQMILADALTSKAGRKKTSDLPRNQQLAAAQSRRRERIKSEQRRRVDVWITPQAASYLDEIQARFACSTLAETLEMVLTAAVKGESLAMKSA